MLTTGVSAYCYDPYKFPGKGSQTDYQKAAPIARSAFQLWQRGKLRDSIIAYTRAVEIYPFDANMHNGRGVVLSELGKKSEALSEYRKAIALEPAWGDPYNNIADDLLAQKDYRGAEDAIRKSIKLTPNEPVALITLAEICIATGRPAEAKKCLESASLMKPAPEQAAAIRHNIKVNLDKVNKMLGSNESK